MHVHKTLETTIMSDLRSSPTTTSSDGGGGRGSSNSPPLPPIPPGHDSHDVRKPHPHDVLSGRGGRINSHPGNVRFREIVDANKRRYLDPRTKKVDKARIAARIVSDIRSSDPPGRFLKVDPDTGLWVEIGDEKAWKKTGQALRESGPEIRAERQAQLMMMATSGVGVGAATNNNGNNGRGGGDDLLLVENGGGNGSERKHQARQADPPGPRHRPNPPEREGLTAVRGGGGGYEDDPPRGGSYGGRHQHQNQQQQLGQQQQEFDVGVEDRELARMREEYYRMQRLQAEQERRMREYQEYLRQRQREQQQQIQQQQQRGGGNSGGNNYSNDFDRDVYDEYHQMERRVHQSEHLNDGLLPADDGYAFPVPASRGDYRRQMERQQYSQHDQQGPRQYYRNDGGSNGAVQAHEAFDDRHLNSCDNKTLSTMSSFDVHSMDMSSLGGFSWNQSNMSYNMSSGPISFGGSTQVSSGGRHGNSGFDAASGRSTNGSRGGMDGGSSGRGGGGGLTALERKLARVNEAHQRQQALDMQMGQARDQQGAMATIPHSPVLTQQQQRQMTMNQDGAQRSAAATTGGGEPQQQQRSPNHSRQHSRKYQDVSLNSFGFEAIDEDDDDVTEASYKVSQLGLSEMDMTFTSDVLSIKSKSVTKRRGSDEDEKNDDAGDRRVSMEGKPPAVEGEKPSSDDNKVIPSEENAHGIEAAHHQHVNASRQSNHSLSSTGSGSFSQKKVAAPSMGASSFSMDDFNESFKSMEVVEDRSMKDGGDNREQELKQRPLPDPDGVVGGQQTNPPATTRPLHSSSRRKDPDGGRLPTINPTSHRGRGSGGGAVAHCTTETRRQSVESLGLSDPDLLASYRNNNDFGASLGSFRSGNSEGSLWVNQYNSMENVSDDRTNPWGEEDRTNTSSDGNMSTASEISAPRMVAATGGEGA